MLLKLNTAPAIEPVTLAEAKAHLRIDSQSLSDNLGSSQTISPGPHVAIAAFGLLGAAVAVSGYQVLIFLESGACGSGGSVAAKIQESDNGTAWTDWSGGVFTTVTETNDNATQEKEYTGGKAYVRVVATVAIATCDFGVSVLRKASYSTEDAYLSALITAAREYVELFCGPLITQTWDQYQQNWWDWEQRQISHHYHNRCRFGYQSRLAINKPRLLTVTSVIYTDEDGTPATLNASTYTVDTINECKPGIVLNLDQSWPAVTLFNVNPIKITFTCGYGPAASDVPTPVRQALLLLVSHLYENREPFNISINGNSVVAIPFTVDALLANYRVY